jgi:type VI secretion system secreted protein VgrG
MTSPLGQDVLLLTGFSGDEGLSRLFSFRLAMLSENDSIAPADIVGKSVTWSVSQHDQPPRYFNGLVSRFAAGQTGARGLRMYRAEVVPWLWFLTRTANCRIFQNKSVPDIVQGLFDELGYSDYQANLQRSYAKWDYCVQYRETAFNFVSRLMEQEGIFYFFNHSDGKHTLVLADSKSAYTDCVESQITYAKGGGSLNQIDSWEHHYEFRSGKWTQTDYNFETPSTNLLSTTNTLVQLPGVQNFELFDFPGEYEVKGDGDAWTKVRMEEEEAPYDVATGSGGCCTFTPAGKFTLDAPAGSTEAGKSYVLTAVRHSAVDTTFVSTGQTPDYSNTFTCIPDSVTFRAPRLTPKPLAQGPQTAVVVGPSGEEIYTDKYGRVKVQFFWDRLGKKDENSSCWIRVAELWAGKNWGMIFNPRIGQEVVVEFLEGDPDRPMITGRVYNADQMPPYTLPANQTQSGVKTRSSKGGGTSDFNELRFEDKKDSEEVYFHAQKDFNRVVENNDTLKVGSSQADDGSQTIEIWKDRTETVKTGNEKVTIEQGNRDVTVKTGNDTHTVEQGNRDVIVKMGNDTHDIKMGNREVKIEMGNDTLTISMGNQTTKLDLGQSSTEAMQSIELKVGMSSVKLDQTGVTIQGMMVKINGQVQTQVQGTMTEVSGNAMLQLSGAVTMIG